MIHLLHGPFTCVIIPFIAAALMVSTGCIATTPHSSPTGTSVPESLTPTAVRTFAPSPTATQSPVPTPTKARVARQAIYWGAMIVDNGKFAPWDTQVITNFEAIAGKKMSIMHWGQAWWQCDPKCGYLYFNLQVDQYNYVRNQGMIPLVDWGSWDTGATVTYSQTQFSLSTIISGTHDEFLRQWATQAREWGHPFFLRFDWEMNGDWYPWSELRNNNRAGQFIQAWRHVHDIFTAVGARNVTWVWCPNVSYPWGGIPIDKLYPGDGYVDWMCMDGYNKGTNPAQPEGWKSFAQLFEPTYNILLGLNPNKPIMIGEFASSEMGGSKANWIYDAIKFQIPSNFPDIQAIVWFDWYADQMDYPIETSRSSEQAFAAAIASPYYAQNEFADLNVSPIPRLSQLP